MHPSIESYVVLQKAGLEPDPPSHFPDTPSRTPVRVGSGWSAGPCGRADRLFCMLFKCYCMCEDHAAA